MSRGFGHLQHGVFGTEHSQKAREGRTQVGHQDAAGQEEYQQSNARQRTRKEFVKPL